MDRDIRPTAEFAATTAFYDALFAPGRDHVYAVTEAVPAPNEAHAYLAGLCFRGALEDGPSTGLYRVELSNGELTPIGPPGARLPRPSPDGVHLACVSRNADNAETLTLLASDGGPTAFAPPAIEGTIEQIEWSADSRALLLLVAGAGADLAGHQGGSATPVKHEGPAWLPEVQTGDAAFLWRRLWILDVSSGALRQVSAPGTNVWEASWRQPDRIATICSDSHSEGSWYHASLRLIDTGSGQEQLLYRPGDQIGLPAASPCGKQVAFVEAFCSDRGLVSGVLKLATVETGEVRALDTGGVEVTSLCWRDDGRIHVAGQQGLDTVVGDVDAVRGGLEELWRTTEKTCGDWAPWAKPLSNGRSLVVAEAYDQPPHLAILSPDGMTVVRSFASAGAAAAMTGLGSARPIRWAARDGLEIEGWLVRPDGTKGSLPLVLDIHGGPVWAIRNRWAGRMRATPLLVRQGCAVLYANPRGSSGRGQAFARQVRGDMGGADAGDLISAIDHLVAEGVADGIHVACTGSSYGGFMSAWLVTQGDRFAAAAPISPVSNWYSQHGTSQIGWFDRYFLDDEGSNLGGQYSTRSPTFYADRARTPCLIIAGALDRNTPPGQAIEFHNALLEHGTESALVVYPLDGHSLRGYPAYLDSAARILAWFGPRLRLNPPS